MAPHPGRNTHGAAGLLVAMENMKHFDGPTFEADVLNASEPVVVDFYADWCGPCRMMTPVVEQLAGEYAGKVTIGKLVDRLVGYPGGAGPIKDWIERNAGAAGSAAATDKAAAN